MIQTASFPMTAASGGHQACLQRIVETHLVEAKCRVDDVARAHFLKTGVVLSRHWRHKSDVPAELATLPRSVWSSLKSVVPKKFKDDSEFAGQSVALSGKQQEVRDILERELIDLAGLDRKLAGYVALHQQTFDRQLHELLADLTTEQRASVQSHLKLQVERMSLPVEGAREALMFCLTALIGHGIGSSSFGSAIGAGQAAAAAWYTSSLPWWGGLWVSISGLPVWVGLAGGAGGVLAALIVAPLFAPFLELGINRFRARKMLTQTIEHVQRQIVKPSLDGVDVLGRVAVYLQTLPDLIFAASTFAAKLRA